MMIDVISIAIYAFSFVYIVTGLFVVAGQGRFGKRTLPENLPAVSVVVCARNEEKKIRRCLDSICLLDYPSDRLEVIVVDDESTDGTIRILEEFAASHDYIRIESAESEPHDLIAKQRPLNLGIQKANGEIIFVTDADCIVDPGWIKSHIIEYDQSTGIVAGITGIDVSSGGMLPVLQDCDQVSKLSVAMGCAGLGLPLTLMGNNMSLRKAAYVSVGGFKNIGKSIVEDVDLMYTITRETDYQLKWSRATESIVISKPSENLLSFIDQRARMLTVIAHAPSVGKLLIAIEMMMSVVFLMSAVLSIWTPELLFITGFTWIMGTGMTLVNTPGYSVRRFIVIPAMLVFQYVYGLQLGLRRLRGKNFVTWKSREFV